MQGVTVAFEAMTTVVVEHRRHEVHLDVGALVGRVARAHERTGLGDVAAAGAAAAAQVIIECDLQLADAVVADRLGAMLQRADVEVILQVLTDLRRVGHHVDAVPAQLRRRADARQHQQLR